MMSAQDTLSSSLLLEMYEDTLLTHSWAMAEDSAMISRPLLVGTDTDLPVCRAAEHMYNGHLICDKSSGDYNMVMEATKLSLQCNTANQNPSCIVCS